MIEAKVVLDPTELYNIPSDYFAITTEVEWLQHFFTKEERYWVRGKVLCDWTKEWLRVWDKSKAILEEKEHPRLKLTRLLYPKAIPETWTDQKLLELATKLGSYPPDNPTASLLAELTSTQLEFWLAEPSINHLAEWLGIQVPEGYKLLETFWQARFQDSQLATYYLTEDKVQILRQWLGIAEILITELGRYPLTIPDFLTPEFDRYWEKQLYRSEAKVLDSLIFPEQVGIERIVNLAYKVLSKRPQWINEVRETKLAPYLTHRQKVQLGLRQPPPQPQPLALEASYQDALTWVTESYLPFRRWEIAVHQPPLDQRISERLAESFVEWIVKWYPELKIIPVASSPLNYNVAHTVQNLCQEHPILWVVVDGLGWLDNLELLDYLTEDSQLAIETDIQPRFSILPTKTEYAKWSLYAQLTPRAEHWSEQMERGFQKIGFGQRYTDGQRDKLYQDLRQQKHQLYCWDTTLFDELQHGQKDWQSFYKFERPNTLEGIAKTILYCLQEYPHPERLKIVIATDHGQIMGQSNYIGPCPVGLEPKGRMAIGKSDDPRLVVLECDRYDIPHDISIIRGSGSFNSFTYTSDKQIIGSHGGLFPEEAVIGFSILRQSAQRSPVLVSCRGEGKPQQSGKLEITIDNPNPVPLTNLYLYISELPSLRAGQPIEQKIPANKKETLTIDIDDIPQLPPTHQGNQLSLSGQLTFEYPYEQGAAPLNSQSVLIINQLFTSGFNIDEFF